MRIVTKKTGALVAMFGVLSSLGSYVDAAAISVDSVSYNGSDTITVTDAGKNYTTDLLSTFRVSDEDGNTVSGIDVSDITEANGSFTVDVATESATLNAGGVFSIAFVTTDGDFSSATFVTGNANEVEVTANILPILTMKLTGGAVAFGDLIADTAATASVQTAIAVNTNAANGYTLQVANSSNGLYNGTTSIPAADVDEDLSTGYGYGINATVDAGATIDSVASSAATIAANFDGAAQVASGMSDTAATLSSSTGPVSAQTTTVSYHARVSALQETGNYTDTVVYSLTGSF